MLGGMPKPPKKFLVDSFEYKEFVGEGDYNKPEYAQSQTIRFCRIDRGTEYTFNPNSKQVRYNGLIFCYNGLTEPLLDFKEQSVVVYDGREHTIVKVDRVTEAYSSDVYSYELEVL